MENLDGCTIEVLNWNKYNPRTDSKKPSWFRLENDIATGPAFFDLDCEQKWLWVFILSLISQENGEPIIWNAAYCQQLTKIKPKKQFETIAIFEKFVRLRVSRKVTSEEPHVEQYLTSRVDPATRRDETNETNETDLGAVALPRLAELWNEHSGTLPKVKACGKTRGSQVTQRWKEHPDEKYWINIINRMALSPFCQGKKNSPKFPNWKANFDFLLQPETQHRVLEGKYDDSRLADDGYFDFLPGEAS